MIYVVEVANENGGVYSPLMMNEHNPNASVDQVELVKQVDAMNDTANKHYPFHYRVQQYAPDRGNMPARDPSPYEHVVLSEDGQGLVVTDPDGSSWGLKSDELNSAERILRRMLAQAGETPIEEPPPFAAMVPDSSARDEEDLIPKASDPVGDLDDPDAENTQEDLKDKPPPQSGNIEIVEPTEEERRGIFGGNDTPDGGGQPDPQGLAAEDLKTDPVTPNPMDSTLGGAK